MIHELKLSTHYFPDVVSGKKTFEIRKNDRRFRAGDLLALNEYDTNGEFYTGNSCLVFVDYVLDDTQFCKEGFVCMAIKPCTVFKHNKPINEYKMNFDYSVPYATEWSDIE